MIDEYKTKENLISEFKELRKQVSELEVSESERNRSKERLSEVKGWKILEKVVNVQCHANYVTKRVLKSWKFLLQMIQRSCVKDW